MSTQRSQNGPLGEYKSCNYEPAYDDAWAKVLRRLPPGADLRAVVTWTAENGLDLDADELVEALRDAGVIEEVDR